MTGVVDEAGVFGVAVPDAECAEDRVSANPARLACPDSAAGEVIGEDFAGVCVEQCGPAVATTGNLL